MPGTVVTCLLIMWWQIVMTNLQRRNAHLTCFTWGDVGSDKLCDWPSIVAGKWLSLSSGLWLFNLKLKWAHCVFSCISEPLQMHAFVMFISKKLYEYSPSPLCPSPTYSTKLLSLMLYYASLFIVLLFPSLLSLSTHVWKLWSYTTGSDNELSILTYSLI